MRKGTGHPTSQSRWLSTSVSLKGTPQRTDRIWDIPFFLFLAMGKDFLGKAVCDRKLCYSIRLILLLLLRHMQLLLHDVFYNVAPVCSTLHQFKQFI